MITHLCNEKGDGWAEILWKVSIEKMVCQTVNDRWRNRGSECSSSGDAYILLSTRRWIPNLTFLCQWMRVSVWLYAYACGLWTRLTVKLCVRSSGSLCVNWCVLGGYRKAYVRFLLVLYWSHLGLWDDGSLTSALKQSGITGSNGSKFIYKNEKIHASEIIYISSRCNFSWAFKSFRQNIFCPVTFHADTFSINTILV